MVKIPQPLSEMAETFALQLRTRPGMEGFVREHVALPDRKIRVDFAYPRVKLAIEVDGAVHRIQEHFHRDRERDAALLLGGWCVLRITRRHVVSGKALEWTAELLRRLLHEAQPRMLVDQVTGSVTMLPPWRCGLWPDCPHGLCGCAEHAAPLDGKDLPA